MMTVSLRSAGGGKKISSNKESNILVIILLKINRSKIKFFTSKKYLAGYLMII